MHIRCPHCVKPVEVRADAPIADVTCTSCGSSFSLVGGQTLADWRATQQPTIREAAELTVRLARVLHDLHETGVIHRDLNPGNIMLDRTGHPFLMDFDLAKRDGGEITMTVEGKVLRTRGCMSPEQARGEWHTADRRTDIYSLGAILYELLTGERPFHGNTQMLLQQVLHYEVPSPRTLNAQVPRDLETICLKCLEKEPDKRYATAGDVWDELQRWLDGKPIQARPVSRFERGWRWCRRNPAAAVASVVVAAAAVSLAVLFVALGYQSELRKSRDEAVELAADNKELADSEREQRVRAEKAEQAIEHVLYSEQIRNIDADLTPPNINWGQARERLLECSEHLRGWEWRFLDGLRERFCTLSLDGHNGGVTSVCYSPDGSRIASGGGDKTVKLWDAATGEVTLTIKEHKDIVNSVCFSPDGSRIASGGGDKTIRICDASPPTEADPRQQKQIQ